MGDYLKVVEFFGLPGCGKSTIVNKVAVDIKREGKLVFLNEDLLMNKLFKNKFILIYHFIIFCFKNIILFLFLVKMTFSSNLKINKYKIQRALNIIVKLFSINYLHKTTKSNALLILDQGLVQLLWSFVLKDNVENQSRIFLKLYKMFKKFDYGIYVFVECELNENIKRIYERNKECEFKKYSKDELKHMFLKNSKIYSLFLEKIKSVKYMKLDSNQIISENNIKLKLFLYENCNIL